MSTEVDEAALASLVEAYGPQDARELIEAYFQDAPALVESMQAASDAQDLRRLAAVAHQLKSTSTLVALPGLAALCVRIERLAESRAAAVLLAELRERYARACAELQPKLP